MPRYKHSNEVEMALDMLKDEISNEMGIELGANQTSRLNGIVGGEMTKRLVTLAEEILK